MIVIKQSPGFPVFPKINIIYFFAPKWLHQEVLQREDFNWWEISKYLFHAFFFLFLLRILLYINLACSCIYHTWLWCWSVVRQNVLPSHTFCWTNPGRKKHNKTKWNQLIHKVVLQSLRIDILQTELLPSGFQIHFETIDRPKNHLETKGQSFYFGEFEFLL